MNETNNSAKRQKPRTSYLAMWSLLLFAVGSCLFLLMEPTIDLLTYIPIPDELGILPAVLCLVVSAILGTVALVRIRKSNGFLHGRGFAITGIVGSALLLFGLIRFFASEPYRMQAYAESHAIMYCGTNLSGLGKAMVVYAADYDGYYPTGRKWCDLLVQGDFTTEKHFVCRNSQAKTGQSSYALNKNIVGMKSSDIPPEVVVLFESTPSWNQVGGPEILTTENHDGKGCNVLFNDGHVKFVKTKDLGKLKWKVEEGK